MIKLIVFAGVAALMALAARQATASTLTKLVEKLPTSSFQMLRIADKECSSGSHADKTKCLAHAIAQVSVIRWSKISNDRFEDIYEQMVFAPCKEIERLAKGYAREIDSIKRKLRAQRKSGAEKLAADLDDFAAKCGQFGQVPSGDVFALLKRSAH